jgi:lysophospholipase L1-like esterase
MKILFFGDSITDAGRDRETDFQPESYGNGYVKYVVEHLLANGYKTEDLINRGISGNRIVDLYARIKSDCWNLQPDFISILIGVNDVWHEIGHDNGVELDRFEKVYRMLIEDTQAKLPNVKLMLCEPFVVQGEATIYKEGIWERFLAVYDYAATVEKLAKEYGLAYLPLQQKISAAAEKQGAATILRDGVHPADDGAKLIATEWLNKFEEIK